MPASVATLYYILDPMCSWCYAFKPVWMETVAALEVRVDAGELRIESVLGGLAPDTDQAMPATMRATIRDNWARIRQEVPGTVFNDAFWDECQPRRATFAACRAVIAAGFQHAEAADKMIEAIQQAYYRQARNPSDDAVLLQLASEIGLDETRFEPDFYSTACDQVFLQHRQLAADLGVSSYPTLVLNINDSNVLIYIDYNKSKPMLDDILSMLDTADC